jgi:hypothetical protein
MHNSQKFAFLLYVLFCHSVVQAKAWDITEEMMQQFASTLPALEMELVTKNTCFEKIKTSRIVGEKGFIVEVTLKKDTCSKMVHESLLRNATLSLLKGSPLFSGMTHWYHRGFFIDYIYKSYAGITIAKYRIDREALFWKTFSQLDETVNNSQYYRIKLNEQTLSFLAKDLQVSDMITPGMPMPYKYCDIEYNQERYFFLNEKVTLSLSVIALSKSWPDDQQLRCINEADFAIQKRLPEQMEKKFRIDTPTLVNNNILSPAYKIIEYNDQEESMIYALSSLIAEQQAIYFVFSGPNDTTTEKLINEIIGSVKIE